VTVCKREFELIAAYPQRKSEYQIWTQTKVLRIVQD
jgi:hypothetical protein